MHRISQEKHNILAALRRISKLSGCTWSNSSIFRHAVKAIMSIDSAFKDVSLSKDDSAKEQRLQAIGDALDLQKKLEVQYKLPHRRSLAVSVQEADDMNFLHEAELKNMRRITAKANAARHRSWLPKI